MESTIVTKKLGKPNHYTENVQNLIHGTGLQMRCELHNMLWPIPRVFPKWHKV